MVLIIHNTISKINTQLSTKCNILLKQTQRARNIYKLFEKIGIDKIKYITTYTNPNIGLPDDQDNSIIDSEEEISNEQTNTSEVRVNTLVSDKANVSTVPIPLTYVSDSVKSQVTENRVW
ncbi:hypothetical protein GLOIN_2v1779898 [Rhizophagus irregularis DAOM 181602=DAOM 197198]|nr:hypothetical protein GLOIN_2v1779898 [Rhizophagus irregularis DAOM 181602=DAOM 197198]